MSETQFRIGDLVSIRNLPGWDNSAGIIVEKQFRRLGIRADDWEWLHRVRFDDGEWDFNTCHLKLEARQRQQDNE